MPKTKISEFSANPANNIDIDSINIAEGCAPSGINDAIRELMAQLKDFQVGSAGDSFNGPVGTTTAAAGAFTTLSATGVTTVQAGTNSAPAITTSGDTNTGIFFPAADTIAFSEGGAEAMRIDSSGNVGIGTSSPTGKLSVNRGSAGVLADFTDNINANFVVKTASSITTIGPSAGSTNFAFQSSNVEAMRIDSSGNVGIGTSSPTSFFSIADNLVVGTTSGNNGLTILGGSAATAVLAFGYSTGTAAGDGSNRAKIYYDGPSDTLRMSAGGALMSASQFVIDASGNLLVGTATSFSNGKFGIVFDGSAASAIAIQNSSTTANTVVFRNSSGTTVGTITNTNTATAYNTSSDYRLKEAIAPMTGALDKVALLKPCTYKWIADGSDGQGFIAHELAEVEAGCVTGEKDAVDADGNPQYQGIDTSFLVATLTAAIQELKSINDAQAETITALTARVAALEVQ